MNTTKHYLLTAVLFSTMSFLYAQNETQDAEIQIKKSSEALTAKNFIEASKFLQKAKEEVARLLSNQLTASLPAKFDNWIAVSDTKGSGSMGIPVGMPGSSDMSATKIYETEPKADTKKENTAPPAIKMDSMPGMNAPPSMPPTMNMGAMGMNNEKPRIIVTISNNPSVAANVAYINSGNNANPMMASPMGGGEDTKAMKIKNYRAISKYNKVTKSGEVAVIIGAGVVQIQGNNIENSDALQKLADLIDYQKIKTVFGE